MNQHLSEEQIQNYITQSASREDLAAVDRHLAECRECRATISSRAGAESRMALFRKELESEPIEHLSYQNLEAYVDNTLTMVDLEIAQSHLDICDECSDSERDLHRMRSEIATAGKTQWMRTAMAIAACLAILSTLALFFQWMRSGRLENENARLQQQVLSLDSKLESLQNKNYQQPAPKEGAADGFLAEALRTGRLPLPNLSPIQGHTGQLLGTTDAQSFALSSPVGTVVNSDRPDLLWESMNGAESYTVSVFDRQFNLLAKSQPLKQNRWRLTSSLPRGGIYAWQVIATSHGREVKSPMPPAPLAQFMVLSAEDSASLEQSRTGVTSHLELGILASRYGLLDEAKHEFEIASREQPASAQASQFLKQLEASRKR